MTHGTGYLPATPVVPLRGLLLRAAIRLDRSSVYMKELKYYVGLTQNDWNLPNWANTAASHARFIVLGVRHRHVARKMRTTSVLPRIVRNRSSDRKSLHQVHRIEELFIRYLR